MGNLVQMSKEELRELIESVVEEKLLEMLGDPDEGWVLREDIRDRLLRQKEEVARGERGESLEEVVWRLGLD